MTRPRKSSMLYTNLGSKIDFEIVMYKVFEIQWNHPYTTNEVQMKETSYLQIIRLDFLK